MKFTRFNIFLIALALIGLSVGMFLNISSVKAAFGISPSGVRNHHMLPGTTYEQVVNLSRNETDAEMRAVTLVRGDEKLVDWITIPDAEDMIMKKGQSRLPMKVTVDVPKRAALKNYRGSIYISLRPVKADTSLGGGEVAILLGANVSLNITVVGDEITDYRVSSVSVDPIQEGNPYSIKIKIENLGNTEISDIKGQIDIYDKKETKIIKSLDFIPLDDPISPDDTVISRMIFEDTILDPGDYWVVIKIFKDGEVTYENRLFQKIEAKVIPVITPEDVLAKKPALPGNGEEPAVTPPPVIQVVPLADLKPAAPAAAETSNIFLIFGLAGLGLGLVAVIGIIIVLVMVLKNQRQAVAKSQPAQNQPE